MLAAVEVTMNTQEIIKTMERVVKKHVVAYQSDFYDYDIATITNMKMYERRFWLVRDTGTYLFTDPDIAKTVMECGNYIYFAVIYKNQYEYEYTPLNREDFEHDLNMWSDNDLEQVKSDLRAGIMYGEIKNGLFNPLLSFNNDLVYVTNKYGDKNTYSMDYLKTAIFDDLVCSSHAVLNMEQRTIDNWYL